MHPKSWHCQKGGGGSAHCQDFFGGFGNVSGQFDEGYCGPVGGGEGGMPLARIFFGDLAMFFMQVSGQFGEVKGKGGQTNARI